MIGFGLLEEHGVPHVTSLEELPYPNLKLSLLNIFWVLFHCRVQNLQAKPLQIVGCVFLT